MHARFPRDGKRSRTFSRHKLYKAIAIFMFMFVIQLPSSLPDISAVYTAARNAAIASLMYILNALGIVKIKKTNGYIITFNEDYGEEEEEEGKGNG